VPPTLRLDGSNTACGFAFAFAESSGRSGMPLLRHLEFSREASAPNIWRHSRREVSEMLKERVGSLSADPSRASSSEWLDIEVATIPSGRKC
jgi:hypothetical protein